jgi:ribosome-associated protein
MLIKSIPKPHSVGILHTLKLSRMSRDNYFLKNLNQRSPRMEFSSSAPKLEELLIQAFKVKKNRKPSKPTKASVEKRLDQKKRQSEKKSRRKGL